MMEKDRSAWMDTDTVDSRGLLQQLPQSFIRSYFVAVVATGCDSLRNVR
jgi:hypothetical protein